MAGFTGNRAQFDGDWVKIFRHRSSDDDFFSNTDSWAEARFTNPDDPMANKYSILDYLYEFEVNGKFTFKLDYPGNGITNIWSQTNNPVIGDGSGGVDNYTAISIESSGNRWGGLENRNSGNTFLDGSINHNNWWYAIGSKNNYQRNNLNFPGPGSPTELAELWVKYKNV